MNERLLRVYREDDGWYALHIIHEDGHSSALHFESAQEVANYIALQFPGQTVEWRIP